jgi:hypothetical protein
MTRFKSLCSSRRISFFLSVPLLLPFVAIAQSPTSQIVFGDNFAKGPSPLWNNYDGLWTANGGQYYAQVPNYEPLTYTGLPFVLTNFTLTVTTAYLLLVLGGQGYGQGDRGGLAGTSLYFANAQRTVLSQVENVFVPGETYTITVTARGDTYSVYINGAITPVITFVNSDYPYGQVGLYDDQPNTITGDGFGVPTTFSNFLLSGIEVPPSVRILSPDSGFVGSEVKIVGVNLQGATAVSFNGAPARFLQRYPSTEIVTIVPEAATTGPIEITTPIGTAVSAVDFTVSAP